MGLDMDIAAGKPAPLFKQEGRGQKGYPLATTLGSTGVGMGMGKGGGKPATLFKQELKKKPDSTEWPPTQSVRALARAWA